MMSILINRIGHFNQLPCGVGWVFLLFLLTCSVLSAQKLGTLQRELDTAKTPKEKVGLLVKLADQYADKKDYPKALEYLARALKLNKEEAMYKFNDGALTRVLSDENLQALTLDQFKTYVSRLPREILTADFLNLLANRAFKVYNSSFASELAQKALRLSLVQGDKLQQATAYLALSNFFSNRDHEESKTYARKAFESFGEARDTFGIIKSLILFGRKTSEPNEAKRALNDAMALSVCFEDEALIYECLMRQRDLERNKGNFREAQKLEVSIYESALKTRDTFKIMESIWDKGVTLLYMGNYREAMPLFEQALRQDKKDKNNFNLSHQHSILGECYWGIGVYDTAVMHYQKAIEIAKKYHHTRNLCKSLQDLAMLHLELGNKNAALEYAQQARQVHATVEAQNFPIVRSNYYQWQANFFKKNGQNDSAFVYASKYLDYLASKAMTKDIPSALQLLGETYALLGKWELGQQQLLRALQLAQDIGMDGQQCRTLLILSELTLQRGGYRQSIKYLEESLDLAQKLNQRSLLMDIYRNLTTAHAKAGNFEAAYRYQTTMKNLEDSLFGFVQKEQIAKFEASFKVKEKELENERLEAEKAGKDYIIQKRNSLIISLGVVILFLLIAAYLFKERAKIKAEYMLRKQITRDIHDDVGSTLNYLKMTIKEALEEKSTDQDKLKRAVQLGNQAMDSLKNLIWSLDHPMVALDQFAEELKSHTYETLTAHQIPFQLDVVGFEDKSPLAPKVHHHLLMIYKEALQNVVKHGDRKNVTIELRQAEQAIFLLVKNGVPQTVAAPGSHKGLENMKERATMLNGEVQFNKSKDYFELHLKISL